jgi:hypothetical protein
VAFRDERDLWPSKDPFPVRRAEAARQNIIRVSGFPSIANRWVDGFLMQAKIYLCHRAILAVGDQKQPFPLPINMADILYFQAIILNSIKFIFLLTLVDE